MKLYPAIVLLCLLPPATALSANLTPRQSFDRINRCIQSAPAPCRDVVTASSVEIYDRFSSHPLARCLPKDAAYVSEQTSGSQSTIRASIGKGTQKRFMRIVLAEEEGEWKLDLPESLRTGLGENWQQQLDISEQIYLMMKNQLGAEPNCAALQNLIKPKPTSQR